MTKNDTLTEYGAKKLADTIKQYWKKKNKKVEVYIVPRSWKRSNSTSQGGRSEKHFDIRGDLVNGLPRK